MRFDSAGPLIRAVRPEIEGKTAVRGRPPGLDVILVSSLYPPKVVGGAELVVSYLAEELVRRGRSVAVVTLDHSRTAGGTRERFVAINNVDTICIAPNLLYWPFTGERPNVALRAAWHAQDLWNASAAAILARLLRQLRPQVMHTHNLAGLSPLIWRVAAGLRVPVVHTAHDYGLVCPKTTLHRREDPCNWGPGCAIYRAVNRFHSRKIDVCVAPSVHVSRKLQELGISPRAWATVRNGLPSLTDSRPEVKNRRSVSAVYVGQLSAHKGIDVLLQALQHLPGAAISVDVAGRGPLAGLVQAAAARDPRIRYHGFLDANQRNDLLGQASFLIFPSVWQENAPLTILEAFQFGLPVLASAIGGVPELVRDGVDGWLVPAGDSVALASALSRVTPEEIARLSVNVKVRARHYSAAAMADQYEAVYETSTEVGRRS